MRLPWRRAVPQACPAPGPDFDALIDVDPALGPTPAVAQAIRALPGANWISVEHHPSPAGIAVRLFPPGSSQQADWPELQASVEAIARASLPALATTLPTLAQRRAPPAYRPFPMLTIPAASGFAEALSPSQFDALEQLAALAASPTASSPVTPNTVAVPSGPYDARLCLDGPLHRRADAPTADTALTHRLLGFILPTDPAQTAAAALRRFRSYTAILAAPEAELRQVPGLGTHSIAAIKLVHAAAIRLSRAAVAELPVLDDPARLAAYLATALARERVEQSRILFLDASGMLKADEVQATGTVNHTPVYPREVVRRALQLEAAALILVHNHPSGDPEPSREDVEMTRQVQQAAQVMNVEVRDHIIVGNGSWLSFREAGLLAPG